MRKLHYVILLVMLCFASLAHAQQFLVMDSAQAKFDWQYPITLAAGDSFTMTCTKSDGAVTIKTGVLMPLPVSQVLTSEGSYTCSVQAVIGGVTGSASNLITVNLKNSKVIITF